MRELTEQIEEAKQDLERLRPSTGERVWEITGLAAQGEFRRVYKQEQLSFFGKQEFIVLMNGYVDQFMSGDFGLKVSDLFGGGLRQRLQLPEEVSAEQAEKMVDENEAMIRAISKLVDKIPGFQMEIIILALGVPRDDRTVVAETLRGPVYRGGLTDDQGFGILETFIIQNAKAIRDFFAEKATHLYEVAQRELSDPNQKSDGSESESEASGDTPGSTLSTTSSQDIPANV